MFRGYIRPIAVGSLIPNDDNEYMPDDAIRCMMHDACNADRHHLSIAIVNLKQKMSICFRFLKKEF